MVSCVVWERGIPAQPKTKATPTRVSLRDSVDRLSPRSPWSPLFKMYPESVQCLKIGLHHLVDLSHQDQSSEHPASADSSTCNLSERSRLGAAACWRPSCPSQRWTYTHRGAVAWPLLLCFLRMTLQLMWVQVWFGSPRARTAHPEAGTECRGRSPEAVQTHVGWAGGSVREAGGWALSSLRTQRAACIALCPLFQDHSDLVTGWVRWGTLILRCTEPESKSWILLGNAATISFSLYVHLKRVTIHAEM